MCKTAKTFPPDHRTDRISFDMYALCSDEPELLDRVVAAFDRGVLAAMGLKPEHFSYL